MEPLFYWLSCLLEWMINVQPGMPEMPQTTIRPPTARQLEIMDMMLRKFEDIRAWPTQLEICVENGIASKSATPYLNALLQKGLAYKLMQTSRNVGLTPEGIECVKRRRSSIGH